MNLHFTSWELFLSGLSLGCLATLLLVFAIKDADKAGVISDLEDEIDRLRKLTGEPL